MSFFVLNDAKIHVHKNAVVFGKEFWTHPRRCNTAQVEGSHRELCSRFADRLRCNDSNRFAKSDEVAGGQIEAVALRADAAFAFASESRADSNAFNTGVVDRFRLVRS